MTGTATVTAPTARLTTGIAMAAGTMEKAISTAASSEATRETKACKIMRRYIKEKGLATMVARLFLGVLQPLHKFLQGNHISVTFLFHLSGLLTPGVEVRI